MIPQEEIAENPMDHYKVMLYPSYIDKKMSIFKGRKIPLEFCVENPNISEIGEALVQLKLEGVCSFYRRHPRNFWNFGRVSVQFFKDDENGKKVPIYPEYPKRKHLFKAVANRINENRSKLSSKELEKRINYTGFPVVNRPPPRRK